LIQRRSINCICLKSKVSGYEKVKQHEEHLYSKTIKLLYRENNSASGLKERENPPKRRRRKTMNNVATLGARNNRVNDMESSKKGHKNQRKNLG
jgi:hypothetical protein